MVRLWRNLIFSSNFLYFFLALSGWANLLLAPSVWSYKYDIPLRGEPEPFAFVTSNSDGNKPAVRIPTSVETEPTLNSEPRNYFTHRQLDFGGGRDENDFRWNSIQNTRDSSEGDWPTGSDERDPSGKTIQFPNLPTLDVVEDPGYDHNRPKWPLSEYLSDKFNSMYRPSFYRNRNKTEGQQRLPPVKSHHDYEWQQLQPSNHHADVQGAAGSQRPSYDSDKFFHLDEDVSGNHGYHHRDSNYNHYGFGSGSHNTREHSGLSNGQHLTTVSTTTDVKGSGSTPAESSTRGHEKHGYASGPYGQVPYFPPDYYPKKRFRLSIHPGYIAAPVAGLAAFGVASALTKKPLMFELGLVNNKYHYPTGAASQHRPVIHPGQGGWGSNQVPAFPGPIHTTPPITDGGGTIPHPTYPIITPQASHNHVTSTHLIGHHHHYHHGPHHPYKPPHSGLHHHHHNPGQGGYHHHHQPHLHPHAPYPTTAKPWWNPFGALTPRT